MKRRDGAASEGVRRPGVIPPLVPGPSAPRCLGQEAAAALPGPRASSADPARPHKPQKRKTNRRLRTAADGPRAGPARESQGPHDFVLESGPFEAHLSRSIIIIISAPPYPQGCVVSLQLSSFAALRMGHSLHSTSPCLQACTLLHPRFPICLVQASKSSSTPCHSFGNLGAVSLPTALLSLHCRSGAVSGCEQPGAPSCSQGHISYTLSFSVSVARPPSALLQLEAHSGPETPQSTRGHQRARFT